MGDPRAEARRLLKQRQVSVKEKRRIDRAISKLTEEEQILLDMAMRDKSYLWWISAEHHLFISRATAYRRLNKALEHFYENYGGTPNAKD